MTHSVDERVIQKLFSKFSIRYGALWTSRLGNNDNWKECEDEWLAELSRFSFSHLRVAVKKALSLYIEYPPTLGQLINLCMKESGVPEISEVINLMILRDFNHPLVKMVYDKIGSWTLSHSKEYEIQSKAKIFYDECFAAFHCDPKIHWEKLTSYNNQLKLESPSSKISTNQEPHGFKEKIEEFKKLTEEGKVRIKNIKIPEFDEKKIKKGGEQYADYVKYLLSVPEDLVLGLPPKYAYDRQRILNIRDTSRNLKDLGYVPNNQREGFPPIKSSDKYRPTKIYKNWTND